MTPLRVRKIDHDNVNRTILEFSQTPARRDGAVISRPPVHADIAARVSTRRGAIVLTDTAALQRLIEEAAEGD